MPPGRRCFPAISACNPSGRDADAVAADIDGTLLVSRSSFPYFMLLAIEAGSFLRGLILLVAAPLVLFIYKLVSEAAGIQILIFVSLAGIPMHTIEHVSANVLPRFYAADVRDESWRVFRSCGRRRAVVTANPSIMVDTFVRKCLDADLVLGTELQVWRGRATGFARSPGVLVGPRKREALVKAFRGEVLPELGLGDRETDHDFMALCKEGYMVPVEPKAAKAKLLACSSSSFNGGFLGFRPTPLASLLTFLWLPFGLFLSFLRLALLFLRPSLLPLTFVRVTASGVAPPRPSVLVLNHHVTTFHSLLLSAALRRGRVATLRRVVASDICEELGVEGHVAVSTKSVALDDVLAAVPSRWVVPVVVGTVGETVFAVRRDEWRWTDMVLSMMNPLPEFQVKFSEAEIGEED